MSNYIVEIDQGIQGDSAYEIWIKNGNSGTEQDFLNSLKGKDGESIKGDNGDSAYQVWLNLGNTGTEQDFLNSLKGEDGIGIKGDDGDSAYQVALNNGFVGTEAEWLESLVGKDGISIKGDDGDSAYQIWLNLGNTGTEQDFIASLKGEDGVGVKGDDGDSAYQVALDNGFIGTEAEWLESLVGKDGQNGVGVPTGGTSGQVLSKKSNTDFDTEWVDNSGGGDNKYSITRYFNFLSHSENTVSNTYVSVGFSSVNFSSNGIGVILNNSVPGFTDVKQNYLQNTNTPTGLVTNHLAFNAGNNVSLRDKTRLTYQWGLSTNNDKESKLIMCITDSWVSPAPNSTIQAMGETIGVGFDRYDSIYHLFIFKNSSSKLKIPLTDFIGNLTTQDITARSIFIRYEFIMEILNYNKIAFTFTNKMNGHTGTYVYEDEQILPNTYMTKNPCFIHRTGLTTSSTPSISLIDRLHIFLFKRESND